jgi:hypothetical protein
MKEFVTCLAKNTSMTTLNVEHNGIRRDGGDALADAMFRNAHVDTLLFTTNLVGDCKLLDVIYFTFHFCLVVLSH